MAIKFVKTLPDFLDIDDMNCILEPSIDNKGGLFLGNVKAFQNLGLLQKHKIQAILTTSVDNGLSHPKEIIPHHKCLNAIDRQFYDLSKHYQESIEFITKYIKETNVFVHCHAGCSRSASIVIAYLMTACNMTLEEALRHTKDKRPVIYPNPAFMKQLQKYYLSIKDQVLANKQKVQQEKQEKKQQQQQLQQLDNNLLVTDESRVRQNGEEIKQLKKNHRFILQDITEDFFSTEDSNTQVNNNNNTNYYRYNSKNNLKEQQNTNNTNTSQNSENNMNFVNFSFNNENFTTTTTNNNNKQQLISKRGYFKPKITKQTDNNNTVSSSIDFKKLTETKNISFISAINE